MSPEPSSDPETIQSLDPILGGPGWNKRLRTDIPKGEAVELMFRSELRKIGNFKHVVSCKIDMPTKDRPHFFLAYGTKSSMGLATFRDTERKALVQHDRNRGKAKLRKREQTTGMADMFSNDDSGSDKSFDEMVDSAIYNAKYEIPYFIEKNGRVVLFDKLWPHIIEKYPLRVTDIKDICLLLAKDNKIENTWGRRPRKPQDGTVIRLVSKGPSLDKP